MHEVNYYAVMIFLFGAFLYFLGAAFAAITIVPAIYRRKDWYADVNKCNDSTKGIAWLLWTFITFLVVAFAIAYWPYTLSLKRF